VLFTKEVVVSPFPLLIFTGPSTFGAIERGRVERSLNVRAVGNVQSAVHRRGAETRDREAPVKVVRLPPSPLLMLTTGPAMGNGPVPNCELPKIWFDVLAGPLVSVKAGPGPPLPCSELVSMSVSVSPPVRPEPPVLSTLVNPMIVERTMCSSL